MVASAFVLFHIVPVDPARSILGPNASEAQVAAVRSDLGLDQPLIVQFRRYAENTLELDFGRSFVDGRPVSAELNKRLRISLAIALEANLILAAYLLLIAAIGFGRRGARMGEAANFACVALPTLFVAVLVALASIAYYPYTRFSGSLQSWSDWLYLLPPAFVLALYPMGILGRILRAQITQQQAARHVRSALAMGLTPWRIKTSYVFRNAGVPLLAAWGSQVPLLLTNTFIVELIFSVPGVGALLLRSVLERDLPMMEGIVVVVSLLVLAVQLAVELIYPLADPRIRAQHAR